MLRNCSNAIAAAADEAADERNQPQAPPGLGSCLGDRTLPQDHRVPDPVGGAGGDGAGLAQMKYITCDCSR